jgi:hypothetical protein
MGVCDVQRMIGAIIGLEESSRNSFPWMKNHSYIMKYKDFSLW